MANVARLERGEEQALWTKAGPVVSHLPQAEIVALEEQASATIGDPTALGLWAFATGTWMVGTVIGGLFPDAAYAATAPVLLVFAGVAQFIAGLFAYRRANSLSATAFCCFGAFNVVAALTSLLQETRFVPAGGDTRVLLGFLLESFAFIAFALTLAAMRTNLALICVLGLLGVGYALSGIPDLANSLAGGFGVVGNIGGWFLVSSALCAFYAGAAMVVNSSWKRTVFPLWGAP